MHLVCRLLVSVITRGAARVKINQIFEALATNISFRWDAEFNAINAHLSILAANPLLSTRISPPRNIVLLTGGMDVIDWSTVAW